jgi:hypothetical protein
MWGLETIIAMNREAGERAEEEGAKPIRFGSAEDIYADPPLGIPFLGDACDEWDETYKRLDRLFVDISGYGSEAETALTIQQMQEWMTKLMEEHGPLMAAMDSHAQFQGWVVLWAAGSNDT